MKIKEKGLTGKAAKNRRELMTRPRGFNAFLELNKDDKKKSDDAPKEVFLDFMGTNLLIHKDNEGNGTVKTEDVPFVKGATLRFDGCGGDVSWAEIKVGFTDLKGM
jgi:lupus La protein